MLADHEKTNNNNNNNDNINNNIKLRNASSTAIYIFSNTLLSFKRVKIPIHVPARINTCHVMYIYKQILTDKFVILILNIFAATKLLYIYTFAQQGNIVQQ